MSAVSRSRSGYERWGLLALVLFLGWPAPGAAVQGTGSAGVALLQLSADARAAALGGVRAAQAADEAALFHNPARLGGAGRSLSLGIQVLPAGMTTGLLAGAFRLGPGSAGLGIRFLEMGAVDEVEPDPDYGGQRGRPTGRRVGGGEFAAEAGYGAGLGEFLQVGATARLLRVELAGQTATGAAVDLGAAAVLLGETLLLGAVLADLGPELGLGRPVKLPRSLRVAAALRPGRQTAILLEANHRESRTSFAAGFEAGIARAAGTELVGRVGYDGRRRSEAGGSGLAFGGGVTVAELTIDYAFRPAGGLGAAHLFGLRFGGRR